MRTNTIISQLANENHMIKVKYNELYERCKELEKKIAELESAKDHIENPLYPTPPPTSPISTLSYGTIDYNAIIQSLEQKILELNKQIIEQNKHNR